MVLHSSICLLSFPQIGLEKLPKVCVFVSKNSANLATCVSFKNQDHGTNLGIKGIFCHVELTQERGTVNSRNDNGVFLPSVCVGFFKVTDWVEMKSALSFNGSIKFFIIYGFFFVISVEKYYLKLFQMLSKFFSFFNLTYLRQPDLFQVFSRKTVQVSIPVQVSHCQPPIKP